VATAPELSPAGRLAYRAGERTGEAQQTASGLPAVDHHGSDPDVSDWNPAEVTEGRDGAAEWTETQHEEHLLKGRILYYSLMFKKVQKDKVL